MEEKKLIRKQIFKLRKECTDSQVEAWSRQIAQKVAELPEFQSAQKILAYADYNHEVMTGFIIEEAWKQGKEVAVPKVVGQDMVFYKLTDFSQLEKGYFGIPEPARGEIVQWEDAMMVMPGVAFDPQNHRVGYGGGFYDRFLEKHLQIKRVQLLLISRSYLLFRQNRQISRRRLSLQKIKSTNSQNNRPVSRRRF